MKRVKYLFVTYFLFVLFFIIQKPVFLLYHWSLSVPAGFLNSLKVMLHGIPMDLSVAGYFTALPALLLLASVYFPGKWFGKILTAYFVFSSIFISLIFIPDLELYTHWGFRIDSTILTYIGQPKGAAASSPGLTIFGLAAAIIIWSLFMFFVFNEYVARPLTTSSESKKKVKETIQLVLLSGLMFIAIRGGITTSTMNESKVYFSKNMFLNQAAVNPVYSMIYSFKLNEKFDEEYRYMDNSEADLRFEAMMEDNTPQDSIVKVLKTDRPNIIFIVMESFGAKILEPLGGMKGVAPNLSNLAGESIFFRNVYANSFRTDRGIVSVLSCFPAQPTTSIIKYPNKCLSLESIPKTLAQNNYKTSFLYGGDVDFAYMKSYLVTQKITNITCDKDFPISELLNKWGAPDHITFERLLTQIKEEKEKPFFKVFLTLSSHEPFDVPMKKFDEPYPNSVAYTDSCLGKFMRDLKQTPEWDNTLIILVPDHDMYYPSTLKFYEPSRFDIFMIWAGGAIKSPMTVDKICGQTDIAATLLSQMNIDHSSFNFSKNIFSPTSKEFAFYDFPNGFGMMTPKGKVVFDCESSNIIYASGEGQDSLLLNGKAYLQHLYNDIEKR